MIPDDNIRAAMLMMAGACAFTVNDMFLKLLGQDMGMFQILVLRGIAVSAVFGIMVWHANVQFATLTRRDRNLLMIRAGAEALAAYLFFNALFNMPLANVTAILQVVPLSVALAAFVFLREPLGWRRLLAILVGFMGVMLIVQPGTDTFTTASVSALACVGMVTLRDLITRIMAPGIPSSLVAFTTSLGVLLFGIAGAGTDDWVLPSLQAWGWLAGAVVFVCLGYFLVIQAMRTGEMTFAAPFRYSGLLAALILGFVVLDEWPDTLTLVGSAIVVATGVYTFYRERQVKARARRAAALARG